MAKAYAYQMDRRTTMDTVIKRISEIEKAAVTVMDDAAARKKAFAAEMEEKTGSLTRPQRKRPKKR